MGVAIAALFSTPFAAGASQLFNARQAEKAAAAEVEEKK